jgi:type II secretory ATPase GspE/PulE/Tfp pilus assembly ATPase PilB-like protein
MNHETVIHEIIKSENSSRARALALCSTERARELIPLEVAQDFAILPLALIEQSHGERILTICASSNAPSDIKTTLSFKTNCTIMLEHTEEAQIEHAIFLAYLGSEKNLFERGASLTTAQPSTHSTNYQEEAVVTGEVPRFLQALLQRASAISASDIHLEPTTRGYQVRMRVDGVLRIENLQPISLENGKQLIRRIKILCNIPTTGLPTPSEGAFSATLAKAKEIRARVSILPQLYGEKIVIRLFDKPLHTAQKAQFEFGLNNLGLNPKQLSIIESFLTRDAGTLLLAGPTGSGKSTLLYSALNYLSSPEKNIITLEDPVERIIDGINQVEVKNDHFGKTLKFILRQDPDVVMIGEIRDQETAEAALTAGITGHLVLSTIHAGNALEAIPRLVGLIADRDLIRHSLKLIVAQRLVKLNCRYCISESPIPELILKYLGLNDRMRYKFSTGCAYCNHTGVSGRVGVFELLQINHQMLDPTLSAIQLNELAQDSGYLPFACQIRDLLLEGKISLESALAGIGITKNLLS